LVLKFIEKIDTVQTARENPQIVYFTQKDSD